MESLDKEATSEQQPKKRNALSKLKEGLDTQEERLEILSTFVRLGILIWSGGILTLAYVKPPAALQIPEQKFDPTFIASVFTGVLATFGVQTTKKNGDSKGGEISKQDLDRLIAAAESKSEKPKP
jgi:hypothetical protein